MNLSQLVTHDQPIHTLRTQPAPQLEARTHKSTLHGHQTSAFNTPSTISKDAPVQRLLTRQDLSHQQTLEWSMNHNAHLQARFAVRIRAKGDARGNEYVRTTRVEPNGRATSIHSPLPTVTSPAH